MQGGGLRCDGIPAVACEDTQMVRRHSCRRARQSATTFLPSCKARCDGIPAVVQGKVRRHSCRRARQSATTFLPSCRARCDGIPAVVQGKVRRHSCRRARQGATAFLPSCRARCDGRNAVAPVCFKPPVSAMHRARRDCWGRSPAPAGSALSPARRSPVRSR